MLVPQCFSRSTATALLQRHLDHHHQITQAQHSLQQAAQRWSLQLLMPTASSSQHNCQCALYVHCWLASIHHAVHTSCMSRPFGMTPFNIVATTLNLRPWPLGYDNRLRGGHCVASASCRDAWTSQPLPCMLAGSTACAGLLTCPKNGALTTAHAHASAANNVASRKYTPSSSYGGG
jgi:hypothetical protein